MRLGRPLIYALSMTAASSIAVEARADEATCRLDGVRIAVADASATTTVEISARLVSTEGATSPCTIAWSRLVFSGTDAPGGTPSIAIVDPFVDHARTPPLLLADGVGSAPLRDFIGAVPAEGAVVALRLVFEGTEGGLRLELPATMFPPPTKGARVERRVKSARPATARFGTLGELPIAPTAAGPAGGVGPTGPFDRERVVVECVPTGEPIVETIASSGRVLDGFRATFPQQVLDLSPANDAGWDELARRAYAASVHGDPVVATLGVSSLAWLAGGLDLKTSKLAKIAALPEIAAAPASVIDAIGDADGRLRKRYGGVGHLLPLGRPSTFRRVLSAAPWSDVARAKAAKDAVARLATVTAIDLAAYLSTGIMEDSAPIDPPTAVVVSEQVKPLDDDSSALVVVPHTPNAQNATHAKTHRPRPRFSRRSKVIFAAIAIALFAAWLAWWRNARRTNRDGDRDRY